MGQVLLVRHGQASWGAEDYDVLSPLGWEQGRALGATWSARGVEASLVVRGSLRRHRETLEAVASQVALGEVGAHVEVDPGWDEFDAQHVFAARVVGGADALESFDRTMDQWVAGEQGGFSESFEAFGERVLTALERTVERDLATTVVVTSGGAISRVAASLLGADLDPAARSSLWRRLNRTLANTGVTRLIVGRRGTTLVTLNDTSHLEGPDSRRLLTYR